MNCRTIRSTAGHPCWPAPTSTLHVRPPLHLLRLDRKWRRAGVKDDYAKSANPATIRVEAPPAPRAGFANFVLRILDPSPPPQDAPPAKVEGLVC